MTTRWLWLLIPMALGCEPPPPAPAPSPQPSPTADARPRGAKTKPKPTPPRATPAPVRSVSPTPTPTGPPIPPLVLTADPQGEIQNRVELTIRPVDLRRIEKTKLRFRLGFPEVSVNGVALPHSQVKLRGQLSLDFPRKSLNVRLSKAVALRRGAETRKLKRFYMSGLVTDRGYFRAAVCLDLLRRLKRFPLFSTFAELRINGRSFGVYLIVERPVDALLKRGQAVLVVRRRRGGKLDDDPDFAPDRTALSGQALLDRYDAFQKESLLLSDEAFHQALARVFDLPGLLTWLAFDYLVHNADLGQSYLVATPRGRDDVQFDLLPWDYDHAFATRVDVEWPRRWLARHQRPETKVEKNPSLFAAYQARLRSLAEWLEGPDLRAAFAQVYRELAPYYAAPPVIANATRDQDPRPLDLAQLRRLMNEAHAAVVRRARDVRQAR